MPPELKEFYFDYEPTMLSFVDRHWDRVSEVMHYSEPDAGRSAGWVVHVILPVKERLPRNAEEASRNVAEHTPTLHNILERASKL